MKKNNYNLFLFLLVLSLIACNKKKLPSEPSQEPVFYLKGELETNPIIIEAGNNNYVMETSFNWDTTKVCVFKSTLSQQTCDQGCKGYSITVLFNDAIKTYPGAKVNLNSVLRLGYYAFNDMDLPSTDYQIYLSPTILKSDTESFHWVLTDGIDNSSVVENYCTSQVLKSGKVYTVTLNYISGTGCSAVHQNIFKVGDPVQAEISATKNAQSINPEYEFSAKVTGTAPFRYKWDFGDGTTSNLANPSHSFAMILNGRKTIELLVVDAKDDSCTSYYQVQTSGDPSCDANFTASFSPIPDTQAFSTITILITDPNGIVYSTKNTIQPITSNFEITQLNDYIENSNHQPTKKIKARLNCVLSNGNNLIKLSNAEISIAVAYSGQ